MLENLPFGRFFRRTPQPVYPAAQPREMAVQPFIQPAIPEVRESPSDYFVVIADDRSDNAFITQSYVEEMFARDGSNRTMGVHTVSSAKELLKKVLLGNVGNQANVVLLDHDYSRGREWDLTPQVLQESGVSDLNQISPYVFHRRPSSETFALALRATGFDGKIIVVSGTPSMAEEIEGHRIHYNESFPDHPLQFPVDGFSTKAGNGGSIFYADSRDDLGRWNIKRAPDLSTSLDRILNFSKSA